MVYTKTHYLALDQCNFFVIFISDVIVTLTFEFYIYILITHLQCRFKADFFLLTEKVYRSMTIT